MKSSGNFQQNSRLHRGNLFLQCLDSFLQQLRVLHARASFFRSQIRVILIVTYSTYSYQLVRRKRCITLSSRLLAIDSLSAVLSVCFVSLDGSVQRSTPTGVKPPISFQPMLLTVDFRYAEDPATPDLQTVLDVHEVCMGVYIVVYIYGATVTSYQYRSERRMRVETLSIICASSLQDDLNSWNGISKA